MKITNVNNLPQIVEDWANYDNYQRGNADYTTTELIKPPRILELERRHAKEIQLDVTDLLWRLSGQAKHVIFETIARENPERYIAEERMTMAVAGCVVSGQLDLYDREDDTLYDWKETKTWKEILGDAEEWEQQANINAFLTYNMLNLTAKRLINIAIFKDWSVRQAMREREYPQLPIKAWPLELWDFHRTLQFIQKRVSLHKAASGATREGKPLPMCSAKERWQKPPRWAVMKRGRQRAVKLFDTHLEAQAFIDEASDGKVLSIEERQAEDTRCLFYCDVASFCDHGREVLAHAQKL
jgi:hypothetical protein